MTSTNLTHVLAFHSVARAGSFTSAARLDGVSQPTLSTQVRSLEETVGMPLIERGNRQIRLTQAGERLFEATSRLSRAIDEVDQVVLGARVQSRSRLRVTADSAVHVLPVLARLKRQSPGFGFSIRISNSADVIAEVLADAADIGITARAPRDSRLFGKKVRDDRIVIMVAADDPLARRKRLRPADLNGRDIVVRERGSTTREAAEGLLARSGIKAGNVFDVATREAVREAVATGFGYGLVFASEIGDDRRIRSLPLAETDISVAEFVICKTERAKRGLTGRFIEIAEQIAMESGWLAGNR